LEKEISAKYTALVNSCNELIAEITNAKSTLPTEGDSMIGK
jgi:hypothetical protein